MLARAIPAVLAGPLAGVVLDRLDRRTVMIATDLVRAVVAVLFVLTVHQPKPWLLYVLSGLLMFASPFFTTGRAAILPRIASAGGAAHGQLADADDAVDDAHHRHRCSAGSARRSFGYTTAFILNSLSFVFSAWAISRLSLPAGRAATVIARDDGGRHDAALPRVRRRAALHAPAAAAAGDRAARRRLGVGRRRRADPLQRVRRDRVQPRPRRHRHRLGGGRGSG